MDDQTPELDGSGEGLETLELEPEVSLETTEPSGDPLDDIKDEALRADAKKWRAIARRDGKKEKTPSKPEQVLDASQFLTKADFQKSNERKAIRQVTGDPEIKAIWNKIVPFYTPRRGKETPEDIAEDIRDAITVYKSRNPATPTKDDSVDQLTTTPVVKTGGGIVEKTVTKPVAPPNFKLPTTPKEWYKK